MRNFVLDRLSGKWLVFFAFALFLSSFFFRFHALNQTSFANGWDTYFYLVQLQSWLAEGKLHSEDATLLYPLLLLFHYVSPDDVTAVKVLSASLAGAFTVLVFLLALSMKLDMRWSIIVCLTTIWSPQLTYFCSQWPKNLLGVNLFLLTLVFIVRKDWRGIVPLLVIGFFGHRMTAMLSVVAVGFFVADQHVPKKVLLIGSVAFFIMLLGVMMVPGLLKLHDIKRLDGLFTSSIAFPVKSFFQLFGREKVNIAWQIEILLVTILALGLLVLWIRRAASKQMVSFDTIVLVIFVILWLPVYHWSLESAAYRFFHVGVLFLPLLLIAIIRTVKIPVLATYIVTLILTVVSFTGWRSYSPLLHDPPYALYERLTRRLEELWITGEKPELIIAHKALAEFISYSTASDAMSWLPDYPIVPTHLWRLAYLPYPRLFQFHSGVTPNRLSGDYYYVLESDWQRFLKNVTSLEAPDVLAELSDWKNPNKVRPLYLRK